LGITKFKPLLKLGVISVFTLSTPVASSKPAKAGLQPSLATTARNALGIALNLKLPSAPVSPLVTVLFEASTASRLMYADADSISLPSTKFVLSSKPYKRTLIPATGSPRLSSTFPVMSVPSASSVASSASSVCWQPTSGSPPRPSPSAISARDLLSEVMFMLPRCAGSAPAPH
jgi:hypothetical protein